MIVVGMAAGVITIFGIRAMSDIIGPAFLAIVFAIAASPVRRWIVGRGAPNWVGTLIALLVVYISLLAFSLAMFIAVGHFAALIPDYADEFANTIDDITSWLSNFGIHQKQLDAIKESLDLGRVAQAATDILLSTFSIVGNLVFIVTLVLFVVIDAGPFANNLEELRRYRPNFVTGLLSFASGTRKYLIVSTAFGLVVAVIDTVMLWAIGVPGALLWGLLAFITNYVPDIGFVIGLIPPAILGLLEGGPGMMITVIIGYCVINTIIQSIIQPKMVGDAVGLSASVTFLSLVVWAWILGPVGAVLAVPLSLLVRAMFVDVDPKAQWFNALIGGRAPPPPDEPLGSTEVTASPTT
jgi:predicted PurR-regulated permease PerM